MNLPNSRLVSAAILHSKSPHKSKGKDTWIHHMRHVCSSFPVPVHLQDFSPCHDKATTSNSERITFLGQTADGCMHAAVHQPPPQALFSCPTTFHPSLYAVLRRH